MHILHIPAWYRTPENPHLGSFYREQIFALKNQGHICGVIFPQLTLSFKNRFAKNKFPSLDKYNDQGVWTVRKKIDPILPFNLFTEFNIRAFKKSILSLYEDYLVKNGPPDIIHSHGVFFGGIGAHMISEESGIPFLNTEQFTGLLIGNQTENSVLNKLFRKVFQQAKTIITCTDAFRNSLKEKYKLDQTVFTKIPNMVNPIFLSVKPIVYKDEFRFVNIAYLHPKKNHYLLIDAFNIVNKKYPNISLDIIGNGELRNELERKVNRLNLSSKINFKGLVDRKGVKQILDDVHASILTSKIETFGVCVIESLASGRPVVATKCGGPEETIQDGDGLIVTDHTPEKVSEAMIKLIETYNIYEQDKISKNCAERYSSNCIVEQLLNVYRSLI